MMLAKRHLAVIGGVILLSLSSPSFGVMVTEMQYSPVGNPLFGGGTCYDASTSMFYLNDSGDIGSLLRDGQAQYDTLSAGSVTMTGALKVAEQSSGNLAKAWFSYATPIYLEISGTVKDINGDPIFSGYLLKARIAEDRSGQTGNPGGSSFCVWELDVATPDQLKAHLFLEVVDGELSKDIAHGGTTDLVMNDFEMTILLQSEYAISDFSSDIDYPWQVQQGLKMTAVPEPSLVALLGFGILILRRKRTP